MVREHLEVDSAPRLSGHASLLAPGATSRSPSPERPPSASPAQPPVRWLVVVVATQAWWGMQPVMSRWLQTCTHPPVPTLTLMACANAISLLALFAIDLGRLAYAWYQYETAVLLALPVSEPGWRLPGLNDLLPRLRTDVLRPAAWLASAVLCRALTVMFATAFTRAGWVMLTGMAAPIFTALASRMLYEQALPHGFVPTVAALTFGGTLAIVGEGEQAVAGPGAGLTVADGTGIILGLTSACCLTLYFFCIQGTKGVLSGTQILYLTFSTLLLVTAPLSLLIDGVRTWRSFATWTAMDVSVLLAFSIAQYIVGNWLQQVVIRRVGAPLTSAFLAVRLASATAAAWPVLGEPVRGVLSWLGLGIVIGGTSTYLAAQARRQ
ncbi:unnamed protein product [Pedinophyceae sp. YPF-701]|nr:unnamed protein product [Pedinophyceae sp. YPF-701]